VRVCCTGGTIGLENGTGFDLELLKVGTLLEIETLTETSRALQFMKRRSTPGPPFAFLVSIKLC